MSVLVILGNTQTKMWADRVMCLPLVSHVEYEPRVLLRFENEGTDRQTDERTVTLGFPLDVGSIVNIVNCRVLFI